MEEQPETKAHNEEKHSFPWAGFIVWPFIILVLYALSGGPVLMLREKGRISQNNQFVQTFYIPLEWVYYNTPMHKPLGLYLHWWAPGIVNKDGN